MFLIKNNSVSFSNKDKLIAALIFLYWLLYENIFFHIADQGGAIFLIVVNGIKLFLPFMLLWLSGINTAFLSKGITSLYGFFFIFFIFWLGLVTIAFGDGFEWIKLFPRIIFFYSVLNFVYKKPIIFDLYAKFVIAYVLFALFQYCLTYLTRSTAVNVQIWGVQTAGIGGLYSHTGSAMFVPGLSGRIIRLAGFWSEPSNAAGSAFAAGFLGLYLSSCGYKILKAVPILCFFAGFLALSNAGYLAFALGLMVYIIFTKRRGAVNKLKKFLLLAIPLSILLIAALGRVYYLKNNIENVFIKTIIGVRDLAPDNPFDGRDKIITMVLDYISVNPLGRGLYVPDHAAGTYEILSAQAPIYWLYIGGIIGIILLGLREVCLVIAATAVIKVNQPTIYLFSALAAVMGQHMVYGTWMNPNYLTLAAAILALNAKSKLSS
jgi:hypothetical protein